MATASMKLALSAAAPSLLGIAKLMEQSLVYQIRIDERKGDDEGVRLKNVTLQRVRATIAVAEGENLSLTGAQLGALQASASYGRPYKPGNYRHNKRQWDMWQGLVQRGMLESDSHVITGRGILAMTLATFGGFK